MPRPVNTTKHAKPAAAATAAASKAPGVVGNKRKSPRFRNVTLAIRSIRREQKNSTRAAIRKAPVTMLVRQLCSSMRGATFLRPSTVELIEHICSTATTSIMKDAMDWKMLTLTNRDKEKQHSIQVPCKYLQHSFDQFKKQHPQGTFKTPEPI